MAAKSFIIKKADIVFEFYIGTVAEVLAVIPTLRPAIAWMMDVRYLAIYDTDDGADAWRKVETEAPPP
ncbi:hypothetical protein ES702_07393 [subsurface metagenome]